jgi:methyl-accepting chemotaxis protein
MRETMFGKGKVTPLWVLGRLWQIVRAFRVSSIRTRLLITLVLMVLLPAAAISAVSAVLGWQNGRQQVINQLELMATLKEAEIETWVSSLQTDLLTVLTGEDAARRTIALLQVPDPSEYVKYLLRSHFQQAIKQGGRFEELFLMDLQGRVILSTDVAQEGQSHSDQTFFQEGLKGPYVQPPFYFLVSDRMSVVVVRPVVDEQERVWGVLSGRANLDKLNEITRERAGLYQVGEIYLIGRDYALLSGSRSGEEGIQVRSQGAEAAVENRINGFGLYNDHHGVSVVGVYHWLPELQMVLLAEQDQAEAFRAVYRTLGLNLGVALVSVLLAVVASLFVTRSIATPLGNLAETAAQIAAGDLERVAEVKREDEVGAVARAFNSMTTRLREMLHSEQEQRESLQSTIDRYVDYMAKVGRGNLAARLPLNGDEREADDPLIMLGHQLNETTAGLQSMITQIRDAANNLGSAAAEILAATAQQASGANEQSAAISQTATTVDGVKTISEQSISRAQEVADTSKHTVEISRGGQQAVENTIESMARIKERVEGIAENILALSEQAQQIGEIITTVSDIAAQSNILALNASVEAARAGEQGKGFAVVAVEVRNLAEQSKQATAQVRSILSDIQNGINATVMATEEGTKVVDQGVGLAAQTREVIAQLAGVIDESAQAATQMVAGGRQQASGVEQIAVAMQNINQATVQSLASVRQAEKAAQNLNELSRSLTETVEQYQL